MQTVIYRMDKQQSPDVQHKEPSFNILGETIMEKNILKECMCLVTQLYMCTTEHFAVEQKLVQH